MSCRDPPRIDWQGVEIGERYPDAASRKAFSNSDAPDRRDTTIYLPPFQASGSGCAERFRLPVNHGPCDGLFLHSALMGQIVPCVKDNVSHDLAMSIGHNRPMTGWLDEGQFNNQLCARTQRLRIERDWTQQQMATAIGVPFERYKKYESRSPLPPYLIPRFAQVVDRSVGYILTGKEENAARGPRRLVRTGTDG